MKEAIKDDLALNKKVLEALETYIKNSTNLIELISMLNSFDLKGLISSVKLLKQSRPTLAFRKSTLQFGLNQVLLWPGILVLEWLLLKDLRLTSA